MINILKIIRFLGFLLSLSLIFTGTVFMFFSFIGMNLGMKEVGLSVRLTSILGVTIVIVGFVGIITFHYFFKE